MFIKCIFSTVVGLPSWLQVTIASEAIAIYIASSLYARTIGYKKSI